MTELNYQEDIAIDPEQLLEEWLKLPSLFFNYGKELAETDREVKEVWEKLKVRTAELIAEAKQNDPKATMQLIESYYRTHPDHQKLKQEKIDAEFNKDLISAAHQSFYHKSKSLESAVALLKMEHWMGPKEAIDVPGGKRIVDQMKEEKATERRARRTR
jgi:hypothetical protein